jgi:hypothetical protein
MQGQSTAHTLDREIERKAEEPSLQRDRGELVWVRSNFLQVAGERGEDRNGWRGSACNAIAEQHPWLVGWNSQAYKL